MVAAQKTPRAARDSSRHPGFTQAEAVQEPGHGKGHCTRASAAALGYGPLQSDPTGNVRHPSEDAGEAALKRGLAQGKISAWRGWDTRAAPAGS